MFSSIDSRPPTYRTFTSEFLTILTVTFAQTMNQASTTNILPMMNSLSDSFPDVTEIDKSWFMASLPLTSGAFILISGKFGDLYGLKKVMISGILWSAVWSLHYRHTLITWFSSVSLDLSKGSV
ncbi:hypothetical protein WICPIJ_001271 [Wickerhamomyces pijperi]|uniref:Major facilitator superfamily (MFS) profile domain-containing protein n=1 Tax=Wickerhamomyces pijperi TaxID=599730 RepID=A0A9P8QBX2_WICPI|nr:hypothetical protein WICPIJ_001271 [Wickerhamomyces pijperi]